MDTLPSDLINCIKNKVKSSEWASLGYEIKDYSECLSRVCQFKCALRSKDTNGVHEALSKIKAERSIGVIPWNEYIDDQYKWIISDVFDVSSGIRFSQVIMSYSLQKLKQDTLDELCSKIGLLLDSTNSLTRQFTMQGFSFIADGLCRQQNKELLDKYLFKSPSYTKRIGMAFINSFLLLDDEDYIIQNLDINFDINNDNIDDTFNSVLEHKKYKVLQHLLQFKPKITGEIIYKLMCGKQISIVKDYPIDPIEDILLLVHVACINSDLEGLQFIYDHCVDQNRCIDYMSIYCTCHKVAEYLKSTYDEQPIISREKIEIYEFINKYKPDMSTLQEHNFIDNVIRKIITDNGCNNHLSVLRTILKSLPSKYTLQDTLANVGSRLPKGHCDYLEILSYWAKNSSIDKLKNIARKLNLKASDTIDQILLDIIDNKTLNDLQIVYDRDRAAENINSSYDLYSLIMNMNNTK